MVRRFWWVLISLSACGQPPPTKDELADGKARVEAAVEAASQVRAALELLGLWPIYTCGEPRRTFIGRAVEGARQTYGCLALATEANGTQSDAVTATYASAGCAVRERKVTGKSLFNFSGGEDRFELEADLRETEIDGEPIRAKAGYGECSDEKRYWAFGQGTLPRRPEIRFEIDGRVGKRDGLPIIGGTTLVFDGPGSVTHPEGVDRLTFTGLTYELKEYLPKDGVLLIETSSGRRIEARFTTTFWRLGRAEITIDDRAPVEVPIIH